jgi:hypothetical protein
MPRAHFDITPELLVQICHGLGPPGDLRAFRVIEDAVPADATQITACLVSRRTGDCVRISFDSDEVTNGQQLTPTLRAEIIHSAATK